MSDGKSSMLPWAIAGISAVVALGAMMWSMQVQSEMAALETSMEQSRQDMDRKLEELEATVAARQQRPAPPAAANVEQRRPQAPRGGPPAAQQRERGPAPGTRGAPPPVDDGKTAAERDAERFRNMSDEERAADAARREARSQRMMGAIAAFGNDNGLAPDQIGEAVSAVADMLDEMAVVRERIYTGELTTQDAYPLFTDAHAVAVGRFEDAMGPELAAELESKVLTPRRVTRR